MKKTKIIIPAIGLLLLSTAASVSGTVAWLSMNTSVSATGMQVKAKADQVYLQIINPSGTFDNAQSQTTATAVTASADIAASNVVKVNGGATVTPFGVSDTVSSPLWVINVSNNPGTATPNGTYTTLDTAGNGDTALANYALINTFKVRLNPIAGVDTAADPLKVTSVAFNTATGLLTDPMRNAVSVLVNVGSNFQLFKQANPAPEDAGDVGAGTFTQVGTGALTNSAFSSVAGASTDVKVYVFLDGDNNSMYTNNVTLSGYGVELLFSVDY